MGEILGDDERVVDRNACETFSYTYVGGTGSIPVRSSLSWGDKTTAVVVGCDDALNDHFNNAFLNLSRTRRLVLSLMQSHNVTKGDVAGMPLALFATNHVVYTDGVVVVVVELGNGRRRRRRMFGRHCVGVCCERGRMDSGACL